MICHSFSGRELRSSCGQRRRDDGQEVCRKAGLSEAIYYNRRERFVVRVAAIAVAGEVELAVAEKLVIDFAFAIAVNLSLMGE
jgi:hypothetical protein